MLLTWHGHGTYRGRIDAVDPPHRFAFRWLRREDNEPDDGTSTIVEFLLGARRCGHEAPRRRKRLPTTGLVRRGQGPICRREKAPTAGSSSSTSSATTQQASAVTATVHDRPGSGGRPALGRDRRPHPPTAARSPPRIGRGHRNPPWPICRSLAKASPSTSRSSSEPDSSRRPAPDARSDTRSAKNASTRPPDGWRGSSPAGTTVSPRSNASPRATASRRTDVPASAPGRHRRRQQPGRLALRIGSAKRRRLVSMEPCCVRRKGRGCVPRPHPRSARGRSLEGIPMAHPVVHAEIRSADPDTTRTFFADLFGWKITSEGAFPGYTFIDTGVEGGTYVAIGPRQSAEDEVLFFARRPGRGRDAGRGRTPRRPHHPAGAASPRHQLRSPRRQPKATESASPPTADTVLAPDLHRRPALSRQGAGPPPTGTYPRQSRHRTSVLRHERASRAARC